jgi:hypothetical protein
LPETAESKYFSDNVRDELNEEDNDEKCEFLQNLQNGIRGLMQFSLKSTFLYLERLHRLIGFFIENNFDILAFGPDYKAEMKQHSFVILTYVSRQSSSVIASNAVVTELLLRLACELCFSVSESNYIGIKPSVDTFSGKIKIF